MQGVDILIIFILCIVVIIIIGMHIVNNKVEPYMIDNTNRLNYTEKPYTAPTSDLKIDMIEINDNNIANMNNPDPLDTVTFEPNAPKIIPTESISKTALVDD